MYFNFEINSTNNAWNAPINPITYCYLPSKPFEFLLSKDVCIILHQINAYLIWRISPDGHSEHKTNLGFCANIHINSKFSINIAWATLNLGTEPARVEVTKSIFGRTQIIPSPFCGHLILNNHITHIRTNTIEWNIHAINILVKRLCVFRGQILRSSSKYTEVIWSSTPTGVFGSDGGELSTRSERCVFGLCFGGSLHKPDYERRGEKVRPLGSKIFESAPTRMRRAS